MRVPIPTLLVVAVASFWTAIGARKMNIVRMDSRNLDELLRYLHAEEHPRKQAAASSTATALTSPGPNSGSGEWREIDLASSPIFLLDSPKSEKPAQKRQHDYCDIAERRKLGKKVRHFLRSQLQHIWSDQFGVEVLGMNVTVHSIRTKHIRMPHIRVEKPARCSAGPPQLSLAHGSLSLSADYRSVYRTLRTGQLHIRLKGISTHLSGGSRCAPTTAEGEVHTHFRPRLLAEVDEAVQKHLRERLQRLLCARLPHFLRIESEQ